jgi:N-methylhydantoinase B
VTALTVNAGDVIRIHTGNGAGYGDPRERPPELVAADVRDGFVSEERARAAYGLPGE